MKTRAQLLIIVGLGILVLGVLLVLSLRPQPQTIGTTPVRMTDTPVVSVSHTATPHGKPTFPAPTEVASPRLTPTSLLATKIGTGEPILPVPLRTSLLTPTALTPTSLLSTAVVTSVQMTGHDDVPMVEVPAGEFIMGESYDAAQTRYLVWRRSAYSYWQQLKVDFSNETPRLVVNLPTFYIDKFQVTNARYRTCILAGICNRPVSSTLQPLPIDPTDSHYDDYPALGITWNDAASYCQWVGKLLPTEAQWEKSARGTDGRNYPWGNTWNSAFVTENLEPVGSHPESASPYGVLDVLGPIMEWTADQYAPYPGNLKNKGNGVAIRGALFLNETVAHVSGRDGQVPDEPMMAVRPIGFRCVRGQTPPPTLAEALIRVETIQTPEPIAQVDLSRMVEVPAGEFVLGIDTPLLSARGNDMASKAHPARHVYLDAFYMDKYEVTNAEYVQFLNVLKGDYLACDGFTCATVKVPNEVPNGHLVLNQGQYAVDSGFEGYPVTYVSWYGAQAYCRWQGKRLATEAEWEKAARGTEGRLYPWGNVWDPTSKADNGLYPVGSQTVNVSPYGLFDMLGNASEWLADWYSEDYYAVASDHNPLGPITGQEKIVRSVGGDSAKIAGVLIRAKNTPGYPADVGFRCAYTTTSR